MEHRKKNFKPFAREHGLGFRGGHGKKWVQRRRGSEHFQEYSYEARGYGPREAHDLQEKHGRHRYERCSDDSDPSDLRDKLGRCHHERTSDEFQDFNPEERRFTEQYHHRESYNLHEKCTRRGHKGTSDKQFDLSPEKQTCLKKYSWERSHRASSSESVREQYHQQYTWRGQSTTPHRGHFCHPRSHVRMTSAHVPQDRSPEDIGGGTNARWEAESPHYGNKREVVVADRRDQLPVSGMDFSFGPSSSSHQGMHNGHSSLQHCPRKFSLGPSAPGPHRPSNFSPSPTYHRHRSSYPRDTLLSPLHDWGEPYLRDSSPWLPHHHKLRARDFSSRSSHDLSPPPDPKGFHAQPPDARNHSLSRARKGDLPYHRSPHGNHDHPQYRGESQTPRTGPKQQSPIRAPSGQRSRPQGRHFCYDANRVGQLERYSRWSRAEDNSSRKPEYRTRSDYHGASSKHDTDRKEGSDRRAVSSQRGSDASTSWHVRHVILKGKKGGSSAGQGKSTSSEGSSAPSETGKSIGENMPKKTLGNETCDKGMSRSMQEQSEGICRKDPDLLTSPQRMVENLDKQKQESKTTSRERDGTTTVMLAHPEQRAEKSENQEQSEHTFREETDADILVSPQREAESANKQSQEGLAIVAEMKIVDNTASVSEVPESQDSTTSCPPGDPSTPAPFLWCRESTSQQDPPNVDGADKDSSADTSDNEFHSFQAVDTNPVCEMLRVCAISETNTSSTTETRIPQAHSGPDSVEMADISSLRNSPSRDQLGESADIEASPLDDQPKIISETDIPGMQTPAECHPSSTLTAGVSKSQSSSDVPPHLGEDIQLTNASNWQVASVEDQSEEIQSETTVASDYRLASVYDLRENTPATGTSDMQASLPEDQSQNIEMTEPSPASPPGDLNDQTASEGLKRNANIYQPEVTPVSDDEDIPLSGLVAERAQHSPYRPVLSPVSDYAGSPVAGQKEPLDMRLHLGSSSQSFSVCQQLAFCQIPRMPTDFAAASVSEEYVQEPEVYAAESMCRHGVSPVSDDGEDITHSGHVMHEVKGPTLGFTESLYQPVASPVSEASADEGDAALEPVYDDHLQLQVAGTTDKENVSAVENLGGSQSPGDSPGSMASPKSAKTDLSSDRLDAAGGTGTAKSSLASGDSLVLDLSDIESQYLEIAEPLQSPAAGDPSDDVGEDLTARETLHHSLNSASTGTNAVISISQGTWALLSVAMTERLNQMVLRVKLHS